MYPHERELDPAQSELMWLVKELQRCEQEGRLIRLRPGRYLAEGAAGGHKGDWSGT